ncbi:MAG: sigma-70 family RNA polymerase sigma factor [Planctomycetota bacterium]
MPRDPDADRMLLVQAGDDEAFGELVDRYRDRLVAVFAPMVGSRDEAEDLAQEVFLRIYRARLNYKPTAKFSTYLFHIAQNVARNIRRSKGRRKEVAPRGGDEPDLTSSQAIAKEKSALMPSRLLAKTELRGVVRDALEELNERQKLAVLLHRFEHMSYAEIGESMDLSVPAVKSLLCRARQVLREKLEGYVA